MKLTNFEIINIFNTLDSYATKKLPQKISYAITKNIMLLRGDYECYDKELKKLFEIYDDKMIKDEKGNVKYNQYQIPLIQKEYSEDFDKDLTELLNIKIEIDLYTVDDSVFDYDDSDKYDCLSPLEIIRLQEIICKHEEENKETD